MKDIIGHETKGFYKTPTRTKGMKQKTKPKGIDSDVFIRSRVYTFKEKLR